MKRCYQQNQGTVENPIVIRNCGGVARISSPNGFAWKFEDAELSTPWAIVFTIILWFTITPLNLVNVQFQTKTVSCFFPIMVAGKM